MGRTPIPTVSVLRSQTVGELLKQRYVKGGITLEHFDRLIEISVRSGTVDLTLADAYDRVLARTTNDYQVFEAS